MDQGHVRVECQGAAVVLHGAFEVALTLERLAEVAVRGGKLRVDRQGAAEAVGGAGRVPLFAQNKAEADVSPGLLRGQLEGLAVGRFSTGQVSLVSQHKAEVIVCREIIRFPLNDLAEGVRRLVEPTLAAQSDAKVEACPGTSGAQRHGRRQEADRLVELGRRAIQQGDAKVLIDPKVIRVGVLSPLQQPHCSLGRATGAEGAVQQKQRLRRLSGDLDFVGQCLQRGPVFLPPGDP